MKTPPAFQFYPDDFIGGTVHMSAEEVGAYMRLLCWQWNGGTINLPMAQLERIAGCAITEDVLQKFPNGKNIRMEAERQKQTEYREKKQAAGRVGGEKRWHNHDSAMHGAIALPVANTMANDSSPSPSPSPSIKDSRFAPPTLEAVKLQAAKIGLPDLEADKFFNYYESKGWIVGKSKMKSWPHALTNWRANCQKFDTSQQGQPSQQDWRNMSDKEIIRHAIG